MKGMTLQNPDHRQAESFPCPISRNGIQRVLRTGRLESAGTPEHRGDHESVPVDEPQTKMPHLNLTLDTADVRVAVRPPTLASVLRAVEQSLLVLETRAAHGREPTLDALV